MGSPKLKKLSLRAEKIIPKMCRQWAMFKYHGNQKRTSCKESRTEENIRNFEWTDKRKKQKGTRVFSSTDYVNVILIL